MVRGFTHSESAGARPERSIERRTDVRVHQEDISALSLRLENSRQVLEAAKVLAEAGAEERQQALATALDRTVALVESADAGILALFDRGSACWRVVACSHYDPAVLRVRVNRDEGAPGFVYRSQQPQLWAGPSECNECFDSVSSSGKDLILAAYKGRPRSQSFLCAPLIVRGRLIAAIQLEHYVDDRVFTDGDLELLSTMAADPLAMALDNVALATDLLVQEQEARRLLDRIAVTQEEERVRVARDLHDIMGQTLTGVLVALKNAEGAIAGVAESEALLSYLREVDSDVRSTVAAMQDYAVCLRPAVVDDLDLVAAVERYLQHTVEPAGVATHFTASGVDSLSLGGRWGEAVFRVVQEALTNVVRHAGARHVSVSMVKELDGFRLSIEDDGCGFVVESALADCRTSLGLRGMSERASSFGAMLTVSSFPDEGTTVDVLWPLPETGE